MCLSIICYWVIPKECGYGEVFGPNHSQQICDRGHKCAGMSRNGEQTHTLSQNYSGKEPNKTEVSRYLLRNYSLMCSKKRKLHSQLINIIFRFYTKFGIPGVLGCVDGSHFHIFHPQKAEEHLFFCRKNFHSLNVQVVSFFFQ